MSHSVLDWTVFGRKVHPFSFAIFIALTVVFLYLGIWDEDASDYVFAQDTFSRHVGVAAGIGAGFLLWGFLANSNRSLRIGLLFGVFVFVSRFALYMMEVGPDSFPMWISLSLSVGSAGAWLIERAHADCPECGSKT